MLHGLTIAMNVYSDSYKLNTKINDRIGISTNMPKHPVPISKELARKETGANGTTSVGWTIAEKTCQTEMYHLCRQAKSAYPMSSYKHGLTQNQGRTICGQSECTATSCVSLSRRKPKTATSRLPSGTATVQRLFMGSQSVENMIGEH